MISVIITVVNDRVNLLGLGGGLETCEYGLIFENSVSAPISSCMHGPAKSA